MSASSIPTAPTAATGFAFKVSTEHTNYGTRPFATLPEALAWQDVLEEVGCKGELRLPQGEPVEQGLINEARTRVTTDLLAHARRARSLCHPH